VRFEGRLRMGEKIVWARPAGPEPPTPQPETCYWCGREHAPKDCPVGNEEKLKRCFRAVTAPLIEGDYIGPLRGEVNVCLNVIHYYQAFEEAAKKILKPDEFKEIREHAYEIRRTRYGLLLW
jgi:hypothetical protein